MQKTIYFTVLCCFIAFAVYKYNEHKRKSKKESIIVAWNNVTKNQTPKFYKILVGFNSCTDLIVHGTDLMTALDLKPTLAKDHLALRSLMDLQEAFAHFFSNGAAGERPFMSSSPFKEIIKKARELDKASWYIGGNAALIAQKVSEISPQTQVEMVGPVGPKLKGLFHPSVDIPDSCISSEDQVHLILEFKAGEEWGGYIAPVATRFITSYDLPNSEAQHLETLFDAAATFQPDLIIFSGLHMLEATEESFWRQRIDVLISKLNAVPSHIPVHMELASMTSPGLLQAVTDKVFQGLNALGMNEQELVFLNSVLEGPRHQQMKAHIGQPIIAEVTEVLAFLLQNYGNSPIRPTSRLSRIHMHSLTFHLIATVPGHWSEISAALAAGATMAGEQACRTPRLEAEKLALRLPDTFLLYPGAQPTTLDETSPVMEFQYGGIEFVFTPVLVCKAPHRTVGLGDAISATGLLYSEFISPAF